MLTVFLATWGWVFVTICGSLAQITRNAMQRDLTARIGTVAATNARFIFGLPFALLSLVIAVYGFGAPLNLPTQAGFIWLLMGATTQIVATGLMLRAMEARSFVVTTAYIKTEPLQAALFSLVFLGEHMSLLAVSGIVVATAGVIFMSWPKKTLPAAPEGPSSWAPLAMGLGAGGLFAFSAVGYRGAIISVEGPAIMAAIVNATLALAFQTLVLTIWMALFQRPALAALLRAWRLSLMAGLMSALGSQLWAFAFALTSVARVRTLSLIEVFFAQIISRRFLKEGVSRREIAGMVAIVAGIAMLLNG